MIVINDQLKHHLKNWDEVSACEYEEEGGVNDLGIDKEVTKQKVSSRAQTEIPRVSDASQELLCCGFFLGLASSRLTFDFSSLLFFLILVSKITHSLRDWSRNEQNRITQTKRDELLIILARLGSSPLLSTNCHHLPTKIDFVASVEEFLISVDYALERLQSATSLKIGLGIWSPSVHRVEHRSLSLVSSKRNLGQALQRSLALFKHQIDLPCVVTLAWLAYARRKVSDVLVPYLDATDHANELESCRNVLKELNAYVKASFLQSDLADDTLHPVAQHLHAAQVALWAHCEDDDRHCKQEWISYFCLLVETSSTLQKSLVTPIDSDTNEANNSTSEPPATKPVDLQSYEHKGADVAINPVQQKGPQASNATLVFSGKGSVARRQRENPVVMTITPPSAMAQSMLFRELQTRLLTLEPVLEVDAIVSEQMHDEDKPAKQEQISLPALHVSENLLSELKFALKGVTQQH